MKITSKGQVTIPEAIRDRLGLLPYTEVEFIVKGKEVRIRKAEARKGRRGRIAVEALRGKAGTRMTTDEILALTRG